MSLLTLHTLKERFHLPVYAMVTPDSNPDTASCRDCFGRVLDVGTRQILCLFSRDASPGDIDRGPLLAKHQDNAAPQITASTSHYRYFAFQPLHSLPPQTLGRSMTRPDCSRGRARAPGRTYLLAGPGRPRSAHPRPTLIPAAVQAARCLNALTCS
jgi:hypothetical protein